MRNCKIVKHESIERVLREFHLSKMPRRFDSVIRDTSRNKMRRTSVSSHCVAIILFIVGTLVECQNLVDYRLAGSIAPSIYDLHIKVDLQNFTFSGTETIYVHAHQPTWTIELHTLDLLVDDVHVIEGEDEIFINSTDYSDETQIFKISLGQSLMAGREYKIRMNFSGEIRDDMKGLYRSSYYVNGAVR